MAEHPGRGRESRQTDASTSGHGSPALGDNWGRITTNVINVLLNMNWRWLPAVLALGTALVAVTLWPEAGPEQNALCAAWFVLAVLLGVLGLPTGSSAVVWAGRLGAVLLSAAGWAHLQYLDDHGTLDVTGQFTLEGAQPLADGETVTATARPGETRDRLLLTLELADHNPALPTCVHVSAAAVVLHAGEGAGSRAFDVASGGTADIALGGARTHLSLGLTLHTDPGCQMDVIISRAVLRDG